MHPLEKLRRQALGDKAVEDKVEAPAPAPPAPAPATPPPPPPPDPIATDARIGLMSVKAAKAAIEGAPSWEALEEMRQSEEGRSKARSSVLSALTAEEATWE